MDIPPAQSPATPVAGVNCSKCASLMWWVTLIISVIAVPIIGSSLALALTHNALGQIVIFVLACWASVWLGMWLKHKADHIHLHKRPHP